MMIPSNILISPFSYRSLDDASALSLSEDAITEVQKQLQMHAGRACQFTSSGRAALDLVLSDLGLAPDDIVTIVPSIGNYYVSSCVTRTIEKHCRWSMGIEKNSRAILVIHEWGVLHKDLGDLSKYGLPIIEDCAYAFASEAAGYKAGARGHYSIFSLSKFFPVNMGGLVCGIPYVADEISSDVLNHICTMIAAAGDIDSISRKRRAIWQRLSELFASVGAIPTFALEDGETPGVFMFRVHTDIDPGAVKARYAEHGIESSVYYGSHNVFVPCHQNLGERSTYYIFDIYSRMLQSMGFSLPQDAGLSVRDKG